MDRTINIVVIDDSAFMRKSLTLMLESDPGIRVVATAREGKEGIEKIRQFRPDLATLDIEMPGMNGLDALGIIMRESPLPVLMVSSLTSDGAEATLKALEIGAVDFISKDLSHVSINIVNIKDDLIAKVKEIVRSSAIRERFRNRAKQFDSARGSGAAVRTPFSIKPPASALRAVFIGVSTGGPHALLKVLPQLPSSYPLGIAIVQHMPPRFTKSMAERLNSLCTLEVKEAESGDELKRGRVLIAPGGKHLVFAPEGELVVARVSDEPSASLYRPSADVTMCSAAEAIHGPILGVVMTGMGKDGLLGLKMIKNNGGYIVAQDEQSCVVYGMPKAAVEEGIVDSVIPLDSLAESLVRLANRTTSSNS